MARITLFRINLKFPVQHKKLVCEAISGYLESMLHYIVMQKRRTYGEKVKILM